VLPLPDIHALDVNLLGQTVFVQHAPGLASTIADVLLNAAFEVHHFTTKDSAGRIISSNDVSSKLDEFKEHSGLPIFMSKDQRKHLANCGACQANLTPPQPGLISRTLSSISFKRKRSHPTNEPSQLEKGLPTLVEEAKETDSQTPITTDSQTPVTPSEGTSRYVATISIAGMTCAACTNGITTQLRRVEYIEDIQVNLLSNNAKITFRGEKATAQQVVEAIDDIGFNASLDEVVLVTDNDDLDQTSKALISIEGMTCGVCVAAVSRGLEEVHGITSVNVDLLGNCATVHFTNQTSIEKVIEAIDDLGLGASVIELSKTAKNEVDETPFRTVEFEVKGMHCSLCPGKITSKVDEAFGDAVRVVSAVSLKTPRLTVEYKPTPELNIRKVKYAIESADPEIGALVYHPPSMEERSRTVQRKESSRVLRHLLFTLAAAVPSFVIGIVYMSLVSETNPTRLWFEESLWTGNAMRMDWAMLILTTPVMFYGASIFHTRAFREIWSLWRPRSKVPVLRRLYRFGSMNLLISAGTSVAYFSSLAILIMQALTSRPTGDSQMGMTSRRSITYFDTVTFLVLFILCGKFLQAYSKSKTGDAVAMLGKLRPSEALLVDMGEESGEQDMKPQIRKVPVDLLEIGDIVSIPYGNSPPTDGIVDQDGTFLFDESSLTGEPKLARKVRGDTILTGSVNKSDPVRIAVKELGGKSMLDQIIAVVRDGQAKRAPVERIADTFTSYFTPVITVLAITTWIVWLVLGQSAVLPRSWLDVDRGGWAFWSVEFAIAVFVVACPCGLGLAAPTALFVGGGLAAKAGILVQGGGEAFQEASNLDAIVFDKTGTLTEGQMRVTDVQMLDQKDETQQLQLVLHVAKALEENCTHPIAKAILKFCHESMSNQDRIVITNEEIKEVPGQGMTGTFEVHNAISGKPTCYEAAIGNERLLTTLGIDASNSPPNSSPQEDTNQSQQRILNDYLTTTLGRFQGTGCSTAIFALRTASADEATPFTPIAVFAITDPLRPEAVSVLQSLRAQNIEVHMCTGDNPTTARAIASQLDIPVSKVRAGVLPQGKAAYINELKNSGPANKLRKIAFVGDGTNDTPALTAADVSIALSSGSDVAITSASFILLNSNLTTILHLVRLAKRVFLRVKLNFAWSAIYNVALIPVAAGVFFPIAQWRLSPVWAAAAMAGSSVSVVLSSLALKLPEIRFGRKKEGIQRMNEAETGEEMLADS